MDTVFLQNQRGNAGTISAHPKGPSTVANGPYKGKTLIELWEEHREVFGGVEGDRFPLLTKLLDVKEDTSIKVHPDDYYAEENEEGELGKTECWYIIDCKENAEIIYGHTSRSKTELVTMINSGDWEACCEESKLNRVIFIMCRAERCMHCARVLVLETQQNSDATYRVYDYDRVDSNGSPRELHFAKAVNAATVPHVDRYIDESTESRKGITIKTFVQGEYFSVYKWDINGEAEMAQDESFLICSVIEGSGLLMDEDKTCPLKKGDHFILPAQMPDFTIKGTCTLIVSHI
nr:mannose-6-phosphate isomerase, class I [Bacillus subtilis]